MWGGLFFVIVFGIWLAPDSRYGRKEDIPWPVTSYGYTPYGKNNPDKVNTISPIMLLSTF